MSTQQSRPLDRADLAATDPAYRPAPVRIVHMGLGNFHRAHQVWYTWRAGDAADWGIASFTGRRPQMAELLGPQSGLFTLIERAADGDTAEVIGSLVEAVDGADLDRFIELVAAPTTAIITTTVTESGYRLRPDGSPRDDDPVLAADRDELRKLFSDPAFGTASAADLGSRAASVASVLGRLLLGLALRRRNSAGPIALVPCDNLPSNGTVIGAALVRFAATVDPELAHWIGSEVAFVSSSVDRITPAGTPADETTAQRLTGWADRAPVVAEPFSDWVLSGDFPAGRPDWESAGARIVDDVEPFERRKLWLLNGAHTTLAHRGLELGLATVAQAMADDDCRARCEAFWVEASRNLPSGLDVDAYIEALRDRFANPRIEHRLAQIATESVAKLRYRIAAVTFADRAAGGDAQASSASLATWVRLVLAGHRSDDGERQAVDVALDAATDPVVALLDLVDERLARDETVLATIREAK